LKRKRGTTRGHCGNRSSTRREMSCYCRSFKSPGRPNLFLSLHIATRGWPSTTSIGLIFVLMNFGPREDTHWSRKSTLRSGKSSWLLRSLLTHYLH